MAVLFLSDELFQSNGTAIQECTEDIYVCNRFINFIRILTNDSIETSVLCKIAEELSYV